MRRYFPLFLFSTAIFPVVLFISSPCNAQVDKSFTGNNEGIFQIMGNEQPYNFLSNDIQTRLDKDRRQIEVILPIKSLEPADDPLHMEILHDVFPPRFVTQFYLTANFDREIISTEDFSQPVNLKLDGVLTFEEEQVYLPVEISIFSVDETIFYNMTARFDLDLLDRNYEGKYKEIITGEFLMVVNDARWDIDIRE